MTSDERVKGIDVQDVPEKAGSIYTDIQKMKKIIRKLCSIIGYLIIILIIFVFSLFCFIWLFQPLNGLGR